MAWRKLDKKESCSMTISELLLLIGFHNLIGSVLFMFNIWSKSWDKNQQDEEKTSLKLIMKILHFQVKLKFLLSSKNKIVWWENLKCANGNMTEDLFLILIFCGKNGYKFFTKGKVLEHGIKIQVSFEITFYFNFTWFIKFFACFPSKSLPRITFGY